MERFREEIASRRVQVHLGLSTDVVSSFEDHMFDWVYIDTDHTYHTTIRELELYAPKIRPGGLLAGHDFETGNWNMMMRYGVKEAVMQFCVQHNWKLRFLTFERTEFASFAIQKI